MTACRAPATRERGGQPIYSAIAIETGLALRLVFQQAKRQTEGLLRSIADVLGLDIAIPEHTTLSRRGGGLTILLKRLDCAGPLHLLVDRTGLTICGERPTTVGWGAGGMDIAVPIPSHLCYRRPRGGRCSDLP